MVSVGTHFWPVSVNGTAAGASSVVDAADEYAWALHTVARSGGGTITHVHYRTNVVTTGATVDVRVETINATGEPSGTLWGTNTNGAQVISAANDNVLFRTALTAGAVVALGSHIALMVKNPTTSFGNMNIARGADRLGPRGYPYNGGPLTTNKVDNVGTHFAIEYSDGVIELAPAVMAGACTPALYSLGTGTNPNEAGILFTAPLTVRCPGWWFFCGVSAGISYRIALYSSDSTTPLATTTVDTDFVTSAAARLITDTWDGRTEGLILTAGASYRLAWCALVATTMVVYDFTAYNNAWFDTLGLPGAQKTTRQRSGTTDPDAAAWTETSTARMQMGLMIDQIDNGLSSGRRHTAYAPSQRRAIYSA